MPIDTVKGAPLPPSEIPREKASHLQEMRLRKAVADFEAIFIRHLLKCMRETVPSSDLFGGGSSEDLCRSLLDEELSRTIARGRGIGLAKVMLQKMLREGGPDPSPKSEKGVGGETVDSPVTQEGRERGSRFRLQEKRGYGDEG